MLAEVSVKEEASIKLNANDYDLSWCSKFGRWIRIDEIFKSNSEFPNYVAEIAIHCIEYR